MEKGISSLWAVVRRRSLPAFLTLSAVMAGAVTYLAVAPRMYETSSRLMLDNKSVSVSALGRDITQLDAGTPGGASPLADQAELIKSQQVLEKALTALKANPQTGSSSEKLSFKQLSRDLKVKIIPATNILELRYKAADAVFATRLVNAVTDAMVEENIKSMSSEATKVREFLEKNEVPNAQQRLKAAEIKENKYRQTSGVVSFDEQSKSLVTSLANLEDQERMLFAQLQEARSRDASLRQVTNSSNLGSAYASVRSGQDEQIKNLRVKLTELQTQIVALQQRFTPQHPELNSLIQQRDTLRAMYQQELARVSSGNALTSVSNDNLSQTLNSQLVTNTVEGTAVANKLRTLQAERVKLQARLAQLPIKQEPLTALTRAREQAAESFKALERKLEEARIAEAQKVSNIRVIEVATVPTVPSTPKSTIILAIAGAFGILLSTAMVLLLEMMDNRLHDVAEAELLELPLLGVLPRLSKSNLALAEADLFLDDMGLVEPYRMLLKTLECRSASKLHSIVVSSALSGEGKSVVVSHLAAVSAMLSRRTLLIDADLRRPKLHRVFNLQNAPGLSDAITQSRRLADFVQPTAIENLSVLTCGSMSTRPSQLLESKQMKALMMEAAENYDLVILDTPPLSVCADATTLGQLSDGIMLVTRPRYTIKEIFQKAVSDLTRDRIPMLGVVVNGINTLSDKYYRNYRNISDDQTTLPKGLARIGGTFNPNNTSER
ncbi:MAG: polysaccharide biosynthesis tyrosine autokinase [Calothrix sp. FI2-JRJ7]|jgi:capsular exopolysaccharide synthesis family protein|nr:polysaccharide biosynthesis tyrosine autokinase [Calothrix sp. FI2-JRJ7]